MLKKYLFDNLHYHRNLDSIHNMAIHDCTKYIVFFDGIDRFVYYQCDPGIYEIWQNFIYIVLEV